MFAKKVFLTSNCVHTFHGEKRPYLNLLHKHLVKTIKYRYCNNSIDMLLKNLLSVVCRHKFLQSSTILFDEILMHIQVHLK